MDLRYHACGYPIRVIAQPDVTPRLLDGSAAAIDAPLTRCPRCGERITLALLGDKPPDPAATLAAYLLSWPYVRRQLDGLITERMRRDSSFYGYTAHCAVQELERHLYEVSELAAELTGEAVVGSR